MEEKTKIEEASWNLASHIIEEIALLLMQSSTNNTKNDFGGSMTCLKAVRFRIAADLSEPEQKELDGIEGDFFVAWNKAQPVGFGQRDHNEHAKAYNLHKKYSDKLMKLLKKYGYLVPPKEDKTKM